MCGNKTPPPRGRPFPKKELCIVDSNNSKFVQEFVVAILNKFDVLMQMMYYLCNCSIHSNSIFQCCFPLTHSCEV